MSLPITAGGPLKVETKPILMVSPADAGCASARIAAPASQNAFFIITPLLVIETRPGSTGRPARVARLIIRCGILCAKSAVSGKHEPPAPLWTFGSYPSGLHHNSQTPPMARTIVPVDRPALSQFDANAAGRSPVPRYQAGCAFQAEAAARYPTGSKLQTGTRHKRVLTKAAALQIAGTRRRTGYVEGGRTYLHVHGVNRAAVEHDVDAVNIVRGHREFERAVMPLCGGYGQPLPRHFGQSAAGVRNHVRVVIKHVVARHAVDCSVRHDTEIFQRLARTKTHAGAAPESNPKRRAGSDRHEW